MTKANQEKVKEIVAMKASIMRTLAIDYKFIYNEEDLMDAANSIAYLHALNEEEKMYAYRCLSCEVPHQIDVGVPV